MTAHVELPLFPLNTVLCPGIALPLHIFEDRYRALARHCIETTSPFGIVLIREGREVGTGAISFTGIGTVAEIRDAGRHDDGQFDLLVVGTRRFEIRRVLSGRRPYLLAEVDLLEETIGDESSAERLSMRATRRFVTYLQLLQARPGETAEEIDVRVEVETEDDEDPDEGIDEVDPIEDIVALDESAAGEIVRDEIEEGDRTTASPRPRKRRVTIPDDPTILSYLLAGIVQVEAPRRQALLEAPTTEARLRGLLELIEREILLLDLRLRVFQPDVRLLGSRRS